MSFHDFHIEIPPGSRTENDTSVRTVRSSPCTLLKYKFECDSGANFGGVTVEFLDGDDSQVGDTITLEPGESSEDTPDLSFSTQCRVRVTANDNARNHRVKGETVVLGDRDPMPFEFAHTKTDAGGTFAGTTSKIVAASDAPQGVRDGADFVCDGTEDHVEIEEAIDALPAGGGEVLLSGGTFTGWTQMRKSNVTVRGQGWGTILTAAGTTTNEEATPLRLLADHCVAENMQVDGNAANMGGSGEDYNDGIGIYASDCTVRGVWSHNCSSHGIIAWNRDSGLTGVSQGARNRIQVIGNRVDDTGASPIDFAAGDPENTQPATDGMIANNDVAGGSITLHTAWRTVISGNNAKRVRIHTSSESVTVANNYLRSDDAVIEVFSGAKKVALVGNICHQTAGTNPIIDTAADSEDIIITGNHIEGPGGTATSGAYGVRFRSSRSVLADNVFRAIVNHAVIVQNGDDLSVHHNQIDNTTNDGISVASGTRIHIEGNNVTNVGRHGISVQNTNSGQGLAIIANMVTGVVDEPVAFNGTAAGDHLTISDNMIESDQQQRWRGTYTTVYASGNRIHNTSTGDAVRVDFTADMTELNGNHVSGGTQAIYVWSSNVRISGGSARDAGNRGIRILDAAHNISIDGVFIKNVGTGVEWNGASDNGLLAGCRFASDVTTTTSNEPADLVKAHNIGI